MDKNELAGYLYENKPKDLGEKVLGYPLSGDGSTLEDLIEILHANSKALNYHPDKQEVIELLEEPNEYYSMAAAVIDYLYERGIIL